MEELYEVIFNGLNDYYKLLELSGYFNYNSVQKLIAFIGITLFLHSEANLYITDSDWKVIQNALNCLYGDCLIKYPNKMCSDSLLQSIISGGLFRTDEDLLGRVSEIDNYIRTI